MDRNTQGAISILLNIHILGKCFLFETQLGYLVSELHCVVRSNWGFKAIGLSHKRNSKFWFYGQ